MPNPEGFRRRPTAMALLIVAALALIPTGTRAQSPPPEVEKILGAMRRAEESTARGAYGEAIKILEQTLEQAKRSAGPDDPLVGQVSLALGMAYSRGDREKDAVPKYRDALAIGRARPDRSALRFSAIYHLTGALLKSTQFDEAVKCGEEALRISEAEYGPEDSKTNAARNILTQAYLASKHPADALPLARRALEISLAHSKADAVETINYRNTLATALMNSGKYVEALPLFEASLAIAEKQLPPGDEIRLFTINGLANLYAYMGQNEKADALSKGIVEASKGKVVPKDSNQAVLLNNQAQMAQSAGRFDESEQYYLLALESAKKGEDSGHPLIPGILLNLSGLYSRVGRYADAMRSAKESIALLEKSQGPGTYYEAKGRTALAMAYFKTGRNAEAKVEFLAASDILNKQLEPGHPEIAYALNNLSSVDSAMDNYPEAVERSEKALANLEGRSSGDNRFTAMILLNLGQGHLGLKQYDLAEHRLRRAAAIFEKGATPLTDEAAVIYNTLGDLLLNTGKRDEAEKAFRRAIAVCEANYGPDHPDTTAAIDNLATVLSSQGRWSQAAEELDRCRRARQSFLDRTLPAMSEDDQITLLAMGERLSFELALSLALKRRDEPGVAARSAEWLLNGKAITLRALARRAIQSRDADNPKAARILGELDATRARLAQLALARNDSGDRLTGTAKEYEGLVDRERELSRQLGLAIKSPALAATWTGLDAVRTSLPNDAVLVEFARLRVIDTVPGALGLAWREPRYVAWVIPPRGSGETALVDLGPADVIERAVAEVLNGLRPELANAADGEPAAERRIFGALKTLAGRVLEPLRDRIGSARHLVLSPDAALWLVPWAALPVGEGRYAVEDHLIHLVVSGRDLIVVPAEKPTRPSKPAILADPDYDLAAGRAVDLARRRGLVPTRTSTLPVPATRSGSRSSSLKTAFDRLEGTRAEAKAVAPLMRAYAGAEPDVFLEAEASETVFKSLRGPKALVLSTHGFFLGGPEPIAGARPIEPGPITPSNAPANPLLRCGLILAGYNRPAAPGNGDTDDGLLTGLEVAATDLRGTDLVVLSACETALGEIRAGEGVAGLRQVFQLAGAEAVVASLWKVQDAESSRLMTDFFRGLADRHGPAEALRAAQLAMIADRRARLGAAHPYFWAAFGLTGNSGPAGSFGLPPASMISPVTGRPEASSAWSDATLAIVLIFVSGYGARWWWCRGAVAA
jgi:CHAT domain-containing protein/tetratricopeptide (TPR) repeat protein